MKKIHSVIVAMLALATILLACKGGSKDGSDADKQAAQSAGKTVTMAIAGTVTTLDNHNSTVTVDMSLGRFIYRGLFGFDDNMNVIPEMAESYTVEDGGLKYTIRLKQGIKFSDGNDFNAEVVVGNVNRLLTQDLKRSALLQVVSDIRAVDEYTVEVTLASPFNAFINALAHPSMVMISPALLDKSTEEISANPIGTGPFLFKEWVRGDHLTFVRNDDYYGEKGNVQTLIVRPVAENSSRVAMLSSGQAQFIASMPSELKDLVEKDDKLEILRTPSIIARYFTININAEIFQDLRVRQALNYAVDRKNLIKLVYGGYASLLKGIVPQAIPYSVEQQEPFSYDPEKAKQLLTEAGYPDGFSVEIFSKNSSTSIKESEFLQQQLAAVGIKASVVPRDVASHYAKGREYSKAKNTDPIIFQAGWSSSTGAIDWAIRPLLGTGGTSNFGDFSLEEADAAIQEGLRIYDKKQLADHYAKLQNFLYDNVPWIYLVIDQVISAQDKKLSGVSMTPDGSIAIYALNYDE